MSKVFGRQNKHLIISSIFQPQNFQAVFDTHNKRATKSSILVVRFESGIHVFQLQNA